MASYLGVDLGSQGVKVVQLEHDREHGKLVTYGYEVVPTLKVPTDVTKRDEQETIAALRAVLARSRTTTTKAVGALPTFSVFSSLLTLPKVSEKELPETIRWEAKKVIPLPIEEMTLDSKIIETWGKGNGSEHRDQKNNNEDVIQEKPQETMHVFLTAAPKQLVDRTMRIFRGAGLELLSLETEILALGRSLLWNDTAPVVVVDIGASTTTMAIVIDQIPVLTRSIEFGGTRLTASLAAQFGIAPEQGEVVKRELLRGGGLPQDALARHCTTLINDLRYLIDQYHQSDIAPLVGGVKVEKIVCTGGGAQFPGLPAAVSTALGVTVILGDPWARIAYPLELKPVLDGLAGSFAIPIGLALREIDDRP